ncbi:hypothetical protein NW768_002701 [Fusarium equiseti]|uniref:MARVEL domain-containing protein n=1 Tax=Fusarium equiseti TaxID=61235 RepID=A0ABQ8RJZ8_FUSEQ|nr:hypothetical protein NW768_002701 [Fusarium equiseti]
MAYHDNTRYNDYGTTSERPTGLLTRFVPDKLKHSGLYRWFLRLTHIGQFLSSVISLGLFSARIKKVWNIVNVIKTRRGINGSMGAVEGILAVAVLYTLIGMVLSLLLKGGGPRWLRWLWVILDIAFIGAFIAVSVLTRPNGGMAGPRQCYNTEGITGVFQDNSNTTDDSCNLPWGTFILAILSTLMHFVTASFHEIRERRKEHHVEKYPEPVRQDPYVEPTNAPQTHAQQPHATQPHAQQGYPAQQNVQPGHVQPGQVGHNRAVY